MKKVKILYCDDEARARKAHTDNFNNGWKSLVTDYELDFKTCSDVTTGKKAASDDLNIDEVGAFDLLLLDVLWGPAKDGKPHGIDICKMVRARYPELPIVVFSGHAKADDFKELLPCGIAAYLAKRDDPQSWFAAILDVLTRTYLDKAGQPVYKLLRGLLPGSSDTWVRAANDAASGVWSCDNAYDKWERFWEVFDRQIGPSYLFMPFSKLRSAFRKHDLLLLGLLPSMRGHLEHVLYVYFTGVVLMHSIPGFRDHVLRAAHRLFKDKYEHKREEDYWNYFQFAWLAAATLHDTAYALENVPNLWKCNTELGQLFPFAKLPTSPPPPIKCSIEWASGIGKTGDSMFTTITDHLGGNIPHGWITGHSTFADKEGNERCNHGVASGLLFMQEVANWKDLLLKQEGFYMFLQWSATAMALHSLKVPATNSGIQVRLADDPLTALLILCDEMQVWNRERPDLSEGTTAFSRIELEALDIKGNAIEAAVRYFPFHGAEVKTSTHYTPVNTRLSEDCLTIKKFLSTKPISVRITSSIDRLRDPLPVIETE